MYAPPSTAATSARRTALPILAICCLGFLAFLIAATIILALIPIYLPSKSVTVNNAANNTFYLQYQANGNAASSFTGTASNTPALTQFMNQALGLNNGLKVNSANLQTTFARRRRGLFGPDKKRAILNNVLFACTPVTSGCAGSTCVSGIMTKIQTAAKKVTTIPNIPFTIVSRQFGITSASLSATYVGLLSIRPQGFAGEPSTLGMFIAISSGDFKSTNTWLNGIVPYGAASIVISSGVVVTISNAAMELNLLRIDIYGSLALGSSANAAFTFQIATNLLVYSGAKLIDQTASGKIYTPVNTLLRIHPGGNFVGSNTQFFTYSSLPATSSAGASITLGSSTSGPFTCGFISTTVILSFQKVTYIVSQSSEFMINTTWLGGIIPTNDICTLVGGCGLHIAPGFTLSTSSLQNRLTINFNLITVATGSTLQLGSSSVSGGFTFSFAFSFVIQAGATLLDQTTNNQLYFATGSLITFYPGAVFVGTNTKVFTYSSLPATGSLGASVTIGSSLSGALTVGLLSITNVLSFPRVTFIASVSGSITTAGTWLGGIAPTATVCASVGGCGLYVAPGCALTTAGLNNQLNINFNSITVASGGGFTCSPDVAGAFTFVFSFSITLLSGGTFQDQTTSNQLYCPINSVFTFFSGAVFVGTNTKISTYSSLPAAGSVGATTTVPSPLTSAFTIAIISTTSIQTFTKVTFIAYVSGSITTAGTWLGGILPTADVCNAAGGCGLYIAPGCTLTTDGLNNQLTINFNSIMIDTGSTFLVGSSGVTGGFTFTFPINIIVLKGGKLQDQTSNNQIYFLSGSALTVYPGGFFVGTNTQIFLYTTLPATGSLGVSYTIGSNVAGPFTATVIVNQQIMYYAKIVFVAIASGTFTSASTWLGGVVPTAAACAAAGGCTLYIAPSVVLSTTDLSGQLNIDFNFITIAAGATFQLGAAGVNTGFYFDYSVEIDNYGILSDVSGGTGGLYIPPDSSFNIFPTGSFTSLVNTFLFVYNLDTFAVIGIPITLLTSMFGPYYIFISADGTYTINTIGPGQVTTPMSVTAFTPLGSTGGMF